jgi:hypothetical protein
MMSVSDWNIVVGKGGDVKLIWKGKKESVNVFVKVKRKGKVRWYVFKGELKFNGIEEEDDE